MTTTTSDRRRLALAWEGGVVDLAVPLGGTVGQALHGAGVALDVTRHAVLTRSGREVDPHSAVADLTDGTLLSVVDLTIAANATPAARRRTTVAEHAAIWWLLATTAIIVATLALLRLAAGDTLLHGDARVAVASALGLGAAASAATWVVRRSRGSAERERQAVAAPFAAIVALCAACAAAGTPALHGAVHMAITAGLVIMAVVFTLTGVAAGGRVNRAPATALAAVALVLTIVWGGTLMASWPTVSAAAISVGIVAPGMRLVPALLMDVHEGYAIHYEHFMSQRWTVRGAVPGDPGEVTMDVVQPHVDESVAKLTTGIVALSVTAALCAPAVLGATHDSSLVVRIGAIGALASAVIALVLNPRHRSSVALRWTPRLAASFIVLAAAIDLGGHAPATALVVAAGAMLAIGVMAGILAIPLAKGASSLVWSRLGDLMEWLAITLSLPMALVAADVLEAVRTMMAG